MGTLAGARYWDDDVMVAVILGTGTNACYIQRTEAIPKLQHLKLETGNTVCHNIDKFSIKLLQMESVTKLRNFS